MKKDLLKRIMVNADICQGKPTIRNMRYPVTTILTLMSAGISNKEILDDYPSLVKDDLSACLLFASKLSDVKTVGKVLVK